MALDLALVAKAGSAVLLCLTGIGMLWAGWGSRQNRALGILVLFWGLNFLGNNLLLETTGTTTGREGILWAELTQWPMTIAAVWLISLWAREDGPLARWPLVAAIVYALVALAVSIRGVLGPGQRFATLVPGPDALAVSLRVLLELPAGGFVIACAAYAGARAAVRGPPLGREAALALGLGLFSVYAQATAVVRPEPTRVLDAVSVAVLVAYLLITVAPWLVAGVRWGRRAPLVIANGFLLAGLVGLLVPWLADQHGAEITTDATGMRGVVRTFAWAALVYGILRHDLLGIGVRAKTVDRGVLAAGALATLFIVAQIGQNFLSARYGLLMGGVVAGAFLFAASPIQRAIERTFQPERAAAPAAAAPAAAPERLAQSEGAYRVMLRRALADGAISAEEELALAHLADEAGLTTRRVTEIRHDVERELGRRG